MEAISQKSKRFVQGAIALHGAYDIPVRINMLPLQARAKRCVDILGAFMLLMLFIPVGLVTGALIWLTSPGPLFFSQDRLGRQRTLFRVFKFRSMHKDADVLLKEILQADPAMRAEYERYHKLRRDPRVTRVGRVVRKFSIDEFPQLWNVLRGEMSLVGPRPYLERELGKMYNADLILRMRPGLTGPWQVSGRNSLSFKERLALDEDYVRNWSIWLDLTILLRTIPVLLKGNGAS